MTSNWALIKVISRSTLIATIIGLMDNPINLDISNTKKRTRIRRQLRGDNLWDSTVLVHMLSQKRLS